MADEHADRIHGQGAESAPRDVEPFWADEPETPLHGRAVPLADRTPPVGMVQVEPGVFRPADGTPPPGVHVPAQRTFTGWPVPDAEPPAVPVEQPVQQQAVARQPIHEAAPGQPEQHVEHTTAPRPQQPEAEPFRGEARPVTQPVTQEPAPVVPRQSPPPGPERRAPETPHRAQVAPVPPQPAPWPGPAQQDTAPPPVHTTPIYGPAPNADPGCMPLHNNTPAPPGPPQPRPVQPVQPGPPAPPMPVDQALDGRPPAVEDPFQELNWLAENTPTAEEFAKRRLARPAQQSATMGAQAMIQKATFGLLRMAPGQQELEYKQDVETVRRNFGGLRQVTIVNPKGGAGKTVAVLLLAMTFGQKRGGYVLAWDNNETQGTLGMRAQQDFHARTVRDMMRDLHLFQGAQGRVGDLSQYVRAQGEGMFDVLASDESATAGEMLTATSFAEIRDVVSRFYKLIFVDTGNNVRAENWQASMDATDQLVITMSARNDSAETAARMLDHLEQSGRRRLVRHAVTIVTMPPTRKDIDLDWIQQHFAARTRAVLVAPYERLIDSGEPIRYGQLSTPTKDAWLKIAAAVASGL
ncbi:MAG TPA: chromosome partitioning protein [Actinoplanes sp.]|nr:chromosome partitioning protein [Actinoplanes sp.]